MSGRTDFRKWLAFGTGVGLEIRGDDLCATLARVRPSGAEVLGAVTISRFRERPAAEWGSEYAGFLKRNGAGHLTATVLLPRREVIVRQLAAPGVADRDLAAAIQFQSDSLHPYGEDEAEVAWARIGRTETVLIGIARRQSIAQYAALFAEAGVKVSSFTFSAAVLYSALRLVSRPPEDGFLGMCETGDGLEAYGESPARPVFSATLDLPPDRAAALAAAELRLPEAEARELAKLLPAPRKAPPDHDLSRDTLAYAAALAGACPRLALEANLLPREQRSANSRMMFVPTFALAALLVIALAAMASISPLEDRRYLAALEQEIARLEPEAGKALALDRSIEAARTRASLLDDVRLRSKADLDALQELTHLLAPPAWLSSFELTLSSAVLGGEAEQAAALLKIIDKSPLFRNSEFTIPLVRSGKNELFRIQTTREGGRR
jgi:hypothetical protein